MRIEKHSFWGNFKMASTKLKRLRCLECDQEIKPLNGNIQSAFAVHMSSHGSLELTDSKENDTASPVTTHNNNQNYNYQNYNYHCPICNEGVEIMYNDVNLSLKVHAIRHKAPSEKSEDKRSNCSGKSKNSMKKNSYGQIAADVFSNSGSGKSKESYKINNHILSNSSTGESSILDDMFNVMPTSLKAHRGFIENNSDGKTSCKVCHVTIKNTFDISEHLKTAYHEDNVVTFLKSFVCDDRLYELDFVSVNKSNLSCNLCKCKIHLSSKNPHETVVNILNHNASKSHIKNISNDVKDSGDAKLLLQSLFQINPALVDTNKQYVSVEMQPKISCNLCNQEITYDKDLNKLLKNFTAHFNGTVHAQSLNTSLILKIFKQLNIPGTLNHNLSVKEGNIHCTICMCDVEPGLQTLEKHVKMSISKQYGENENNGFPFHKNINEAQAMHNITGNVVATNNSELDVKRFLISMPAQFHNIDCIAQKEGQLFCLFCNCGIPPTNKNLEEHLSGGKHKKNEEAKRNEKNIPENSAASSLDSSGLVEKLAGVSIDNSGQDRMVDELTKTVKIIKSNSKFIAKKGENYICTLCSTLIKQSFDSTILKDNFSSHFYGKKHNKLLDQQLKGTLDKLVDSNPVIQTEKTFLKVQNRTVLCTLCSISMTCSESPDSLEKNIATHLLGSKHKSKKNPEPVKSPDVQPETSNQPIKPRSFNVSSNPFMDIIQSVNNLYSDTRLEHSFLMPPQPLIPLIPHSPPVPLLKQPMLPACDAQTTWNLVADSFKNLPHFLQNESKFMKNGSIEGFLECTLCKSTINPHYLQEHLREARHLQEKFIFEDKTARLMKSRK